MNLRLKYTEPVDLISTLRIETARLQKKREKTHGCTAHNSFDCLFSFIQRWIPFSIYYRCICST